MRILLCSRRVFMRGGEKTIPRSSIRCTRAAYNSGLSWASITIPRRCFLFFVALRTAKMRLSIDVIFSYKKPILFIVPFSKSLCCALRCFNACALLNRTLYRLFLTEWYGDTQSIKRLTMQRIRPPRFEFAFDAELFPFQYHKPAFVVLFQFPPTYKTPTIRIAYPSIDYSILTVTLYAHYDGGSFPRNPPQRGL